LLSGPYLRRLLGSNPQIFGKDVAVRCILRHVNASKCVCLQHFPDPWLDLGEAKGAGNGNRKGGKGSG